jgi:hypothetical protein
MHVLCIDDDIIIWLLVCVDVGPRGREVELMRVLIRQELVRPITGRIETSARGCSGETSR